MHEKFAPGCAAAVAEQLRRRHLEDGTLQSLLGRAASEQGASSSLSLPCLPEKVSNTLTMIPVRDCDDCVIVMIPVL